MRTLISIVLATCLLGCVPRGVKFPELDTPAPPGAGFVDTTVVTPAGEKRFVVFVPYRLTPTQRPPMIVFLNGYGESGTDNRKHLTVGLGPAIARQADSFPFVVLFVQSPGRWRADDTTTRTLLAAMDQTLTKYNVDPTRVVLTGMSTGGEGVWRVGAAHASRFSALVPVSAWSAPDTVDQLTTLPIWAFHCTGDPIVFSANSTTMVDAINKKGGRAKLTRYPVFAHDAWTKTYADPDLYTWMLGQHR